MYLANLGNLVSRLNLLIKNSPKKIKTKVVTQLNRIEYPIPLDKQANCSIVKVDNSFRIESIIYKIGPNILFSLMLCSCFP